MLFLRYVDPSNLVLLRELCIFFEECFLSFDRVVRPGMVVLLPIRYCLNVRSILVILKLVVSILINLK
jgi:hypothetical protein